MKIVEKLKSIKKPTINMFVVSNNVYWVFRKFRQIREDGQDVIIEHDFSIHFVKPFKNKKEAKKAVNFAKKLQPWQEFLILRGI